VKKILAGGKSGVLCGFISPKTKKSFDCALKLDGNSVSFDFANDRQSYQGTKGTQGSQGASSAVRERSAHPTYATNSRYVQNEELPPDFFDN
jgi:hypothetical protein